MTNIYYWYKLLIKKINEKQTYVIVIPGSCDMLESLMCVFKETTHTQNTFP